MTSLNSAPEYPEGTQFYLVPPGVSSLNLGEVMVSGEILDRLYDATHAEESLVAMAVTDAELMFICSNVDILDVQPTLLMGVPAADYSILFLAQGNAIPTMSYDTLKLSLDRQHRRKPAMKDNTSRYDDVASTAPTKLPEHPTDDGDVDS